MRTATGSRKCTVGIPREPRPVVATPFTGTYSVEVYRRMGVAGSRHNAAYACMRSLIVGVFQNPSDGMTECSLVTFDVGSCRLLEINSSKEPFDLCTCIASLHCGSPSLTGTVFALQFQCSAPPALQINKYSSSSVRIPHSCEVRIRCASLLSVMLGTSSATLHLEHPVKPSGKAVSYSEEDLPEFTPMPWSLAEIRAAIPPHLFVRDGMRCTAYLARDVLMAAIAWKLALRIDPFFRGQLAVAHLGTVAAEVARWATWLVYWWFQGLIFTGIWVIGHECGHGAFSANRYLCDVVGFITHTLLWTPYFSWKISHHRHHCNHASMERDEVYVPKTRSDLGIPPESEGSTIDYDEYFGDTPIYTLFMLVRQQLLAFPAYLIYNVSGQKDYPKWTNHFDPNSILFNKSQRNVVIASNIGIAAMIALVRWACATWGASEVVKYYGIPWLCVTHWFIMITYLHHTDPELPHYRNREWNFQRGAAATVDRDFLGWMGRFFLHDVAHFHVVHHFFPKMPFFHGPEATAHLKKFIGDYYRYSEKPIFKALWDNYNECQFVEDTGDILFYRNKKGQAVARPAEPYRSTAVAPTLPA